MSNMMLFTWEERKKPCGIVLYAMQEGDEEKEQYAHDLSQYFKSQLLVPFLHGVMFDPAGHCFRPMSTVNPGLRSYLEVSNR